MPGDRELVALAVALFVALYVHGLGRSRATGSLQPVVDKSYDPDDDDGYDPYYDDGPPSRLPFFVILAMLVASTAAFVTSGSAADDGPTQPAAAAARAPAVGAPTTTLAANTTSTVGALVSGPYTGTVTVQSDPAGHKCCVFPAKSVDVLQQRNRDTGAIDIEIRGFFGAVALRSPLAATGAPFSAVGHGTIAGRPGTEIRLDATVTPQAGLDGTLTVGGNGTLPTGRPIVFRVDLEKAT